MGSTTKTRTITREVIREYGPDGKIVRERELTREDGDMSSEELEKIRKRFSRMDGFFKEMGRIFSD